MNRKKLSRRGFFIILAGGIMIGLVVSAKLDLTSPINANPNSETNTPLGDSVDFTKAVETVASRVGPAVVSIRTEKTERYKVQRHFFGSPFDDEFFERFFEDFFGEIPQQEYKRSGIGSGVLINKEGYILTNEHVIEDTDKITVTLPDGREFKGILKGTDPRSDLAVVKVNAPNLPSAQLGDSDNLRIGQWVVAIGNPFGNVMSSAEPTVTTGVISALHRSLPPTSRRDSDYTDLIQTDAAINPGNSGGPLVNLKGEIIGINVALFSTSGGYQGIGFAIPINTARRIVANLIAGKEVDYGWIGVGVQNLNQRLAEYFGLPNTDGVLISRTIDDGPAKKAGIKEGDVITSVDGKPIKDVPSLLKIVGNTPVGKTVPIGILRDKKSMNIPVVIGKRPTFDETGEIVESKKEEPAGDRTWRGLTVQNIPPELTKRLNLDRPEGVMVVKTETDSPAAEAGLRQGDVITAINNQPIKNIGDFQSATKKAKGDCLIRTTRGYIVLKEHGA